MLGYHFLHQVYRRLALILPLYGAEVQLPLLHLLQYLSVVVSVEGRVSAEEDVEDDSRRPHIALLIVIPCEHFGGDVERSPRLCLQHCPRFSSPPTVLLIVHCFFQDFSCGL